MLCFVNAMPLFSQPSNVSFERISMADGLSNDEVYCVYQDSKGFIWFGTQDGLNRYDGYNFKVYRHDPADPFSLSDYAINVIREDPVRSGMLWIGSREGLNRFDREKESFTHFHHDPERPGSLSNNRVREIYFTSDSVLWVGTDDGLNKFDRKKETFTQYTYDPNDQDGLSFKQVSTCIEDKYGNLWIGGRSLAILDRESGRISHFRQVSRDPYLLRNDRVRKLYRGY